MPSNTPRYFSPHEEALAELKRLGGEIAIKTLKLATDLVAAIYANPEIVKADDVPLIRESRRDVEHARILLEGFARRWGLEPRK